MKVKKISSIILCIATALSALNVSAANTDTAAETAEDTAKVFYGSEIREILSDYTPVLDMDFEALGKDGDNGGFDETSGTGSGGFAGIGSDGSGQSYSCTSVSVYKAFKAFDTPATSGRWCLSFDFKRSDTEGLLYLRHTLSESTSTSERSNVYETFNCSNKIGFYRGSYGWSVLNPVDYEPDTWYNVMMWMDFDNGSLETYINNEFAVRTGIPNKMYGICFIVESSTGMNINSFDNVMMYKATTPMANKLANSGVAVPEKYAQVLQSNVSSAKSGNIFTKSDDLALSVEYKNEMPDDMIYDVDYSVTNYRGDEVWSDSKKNQSIRSGETYTDIVKPKVDSFDVYTLNITVSPHGEYAMFRTDAEFSLVNAPTPGYKNYNLGACIHVSKGRSDWNKIKSVIDTLGIGLLRDNLNWCGYEMQKGVYGCSEKMDTFFREAAEMGIYVMPIMEMWNDLYGVPYSNRIARTPEQLDALEKAYEALAREYKGVIKNVELGNEINFARQSDVSCKDYAVSMQAAYKGLKKGNPDIEVGTDGLSRAAADWAAKMLKEGGLGYCDAIDVHTYQGQGSPESFKFVEYNQMVRDAVAEVGAEDIQLWITEGNTSGSWEYSTEQQHGVNLVRQFAQVEAYNAADKFYFYQIQTDETNPNDNESWFGIIRGATTKNGYGAKVEYLAAANYIAQTENAEFTDDIRDDNVWLIRYKKQDGSYVVMMYADRDVKNVSLDIGATDAVLCDINGNPQKISSSEGKYTFTISDEPVYLSYSGDKFERCEDKMNISNAVAEAPEKSTCKYEFTVPQSAEIDVEVPNNLSYDIARNGEKVTLTVNIDKVPEGEENVGTNKNSLHEHVAYTERRQDLGTIIYRDWAKVIVKNNGDRVYIPLAVEYLKKSADIRTTVKTYDNSSMKYWKLCLKITNNNADKPISGTVNLDSPEEMLASVKEKRIENLMPKSSTTVDFNIPPALIGKWLLYSGTLTLDDGEKIQFTLGDVPRSYGYKEASSLNVGRYIKKAKTNKPVIDGTIDEDEWKDYLVTNFDKSQVSYGSQGLVIDGVVERNSFGADADYGGKADFSGSIYSQWDEKYMYIAAIVYDDVHYQKEDPIRFYYDDELFISILPTMTQRHSTRIEVALSDFFDDNKGRVYRNYTPLFDVLPGGVLKQSEDGVQAEVIRKENVTIYECRLPWSELIGAETYDDKCFYLSFNIRDFDGDRDKTYSYGGWYYLAEPKIKTVSLD